MTATLAPTPKRLERLPTPPDPRPALTSRPVLTMPDVLLMGAIRSEQAAGFSYSRTPISEAQQREWWARNRERLEAWLFDDEQGRTVGYGLLRQEDDGRWYSSVAVREAFTGHGYGRIITSWLVMTWPTEVWASARNDNPAALRLHDKLLWEEIGCDNDLTYFRTRPKVKAAKLAINIDWLGQ